jgi:hypothetical protein
MALGEAEAEAAAEPPLAEEVDGLLDMVDKAEGVKEPEAVVEEEGEAP